LQVSDVELPSWANVQQVFCWKCGRKVEGDVFQCTEPHTYQHGLRYILCLKCAEKYLMMPMGDKLYKAIGLVKPNFWRMASVLSDYEGIETPKVKVMFGHEWRRFCDKNFPDRKVTTITKLGARITTLQTFGGVYLKFDKKIILCGSSRLEEFLHEFYHHYCNIKRKLESQSEYEEKRKVWKKILKKVA